MSSGLKSTVERLYTGSETASKRFRYGLLAFDFASILYFIITAPLPRSDTLHSVNVFVAIIITIDLLARLWISRDRGAHLRRPYVLADIVVVLTLLAENFITRDLGFLRVLRGLRLVHSYELIADLRRDSAFFRRNEETVIAAINLFVFLFFTASLVFALGEQHSQNVEGYIDALYFTVATLTTTGFGDITPETPAGKLVTVLIMVIGVALFVRLAQAIFRPAKVRYTCHGCGLTRHDPDALHCKHCGREVRITTEGAN